MPLLLTRREVLKAAAIGVALAPLAALTKLTWGDYLTGRGASALTDKEYAIVLALAEALLPDDVSSDDLRASVLGVDELVAGSPEFTKPRLRLLFWGVEHCLPISQFTFTKFSRQGLGERRSLIQGLEASRSLTKRALARGLRGMIYLGFYDTPATRSAIGFIEKCRA